MNNINRLVDIIYYVPRRNEARLIQVDVMTKNFTKTLCKKGGKNFVVLVKEGYGVIGFRI